MVNKKESKWTLIMTRVSDGTRETRCLLCECILKKGDMIFWIPPKKSSVDRRGQLFCLDCIPKQITAISVSQVL